MLMAAGLLAAATVQATPVDSGASSILDARSSTHSHSEKGKAQQDNNDKLEVRSSTHSHSEKGKAQQDNNDKLEVRSSTHSHSEKGKAQQDASPDTNQLAKRARHKGGKKSAEDDKVDQMIKEFDSLFSLSFEDLHAAVATNDQVQTSVDEMTNDPNKPPTHENVARLKKENKKLQNELKQTQLSMQKLERDGKTLERALENCQNELTQKSSSSKKRPHGVMPPHFGGKGM